MKKITSILFAFMMCMSFFAFTPALALQGEEMDLVVDDDLLGTGYGDYTGLSKTDIRITIAKIIKTALGLLGTVALVLVVYAGFLWMTAGGNTEQIDKAKGVLSAAIVGLVIILSAYAITDFVINELQTAIMG
jgi:hypothetical protein